MSFSVAWLSLRADADTRARDAELIAAAARVIAGVAPARILDLGAGTGATLRALHPHLPRPQAWTLADSDAALLAAARAWFDGAAPDGLTLETRQVDLVADPAPWEEPPHLVTASALFDLASARWLEALVDRLAADRVPLLAMLTYDGRMALEPAHPYDAVMIEAFNTHQQGEKSFGPALGRHGATALAKTLAARGFTVTTRDTPWVLGRGRDDALAAATLTGWAEAAKEIGLPAERVDAWLAARLARTDRYVVGHTDLLAVPA